MENLQADWDTIHALLKDVEGFDAKAMQRYYEEGLGKKGIHFFLIRFEPNEVIMAKGTTGDYAALHVQGLVRVRDTAPLPSSATRGCWDRPLRRRLESFVLSYGQWLTDNNEPHLLQPGRFGWLRRPLAALYRSCPEVPTRLLGLCESWPPAPSAEKKAEDGPKARPRTTGERFARAVKNHLVRALYGRTGRVPRAERELSDPHRSAAASGPATFEKILSVRDEAGNLRPVLDRFVGVPGTLWNQPRTVTLVADNDPADADKPCVMLLIKRKVLEELIAKAPAFFRRQIDEFNANVLPRVLARNWLFMDRLAVQDVRDWNGLFAGLRRGGCAGLRRLRGLLDAETQGWLARHAPARFDGHDQAQFILRLNRVLIRRELTQADKWPAERLCDEARELLRLPRETLNDCEVFRLNRLLLEATLPGALEPAPRPFPLTHAEFLDFTRDLAAEYQAAGRELRPERLQMLVDKRTKTKQGVVLCKQGDPADAVFLVLSGMVRVSVDRPGGQITVNNLGPDSYFGESAALDEAEPGSPPVRTATVATVCDTTVLRLDRDLLKRLFAGKYRALADKLLRDCRRLAEREAMMQRGILLTPTEPPLELAERLVLTRNLLLIDMDKCTRCDQCVRGCAENHDGQPRFHRANPELRFGMWEVAGACLHCLDAPCQQACPVGAIALLEDKAVQIHRDRCIGCEQCAKECPFGVIDMYSPVSPEDAPSSKKGKVANKCDLCLTEDRDPPCVACCPYDAAKRVDPVEFFEEIRAWANVRR